MNKIISISAILGASLGAAQAQTIADWDFDAPYVGTQAAPYNTPLASLGALAGVAQGTQLGMNNNYIFASGEGPGSSANCDVLASSGASTGSGSYGWRVRGNSNTSGAGPGNANGWNTNAPIATQGAEFQASTVGYNNISVSFDINATGQAERNLALEYTLDGVNWNVATITSAGSLGTLANNSSSPNTVTGTYVELSGSGTGWNNQITASIAGAGGDANFAIEIVNASTGADDVNTSGAALNNSSGNWRYDNVDITGTLVPEPSTLSLAGLGLASLLAFRRRISKA